MHRYLFVIKAASVCPYNWGIGSTPGTYCQMFGWFVRPAWPHSEDNWMDLRVGLLPDS